MALVKFGGGITQMSGSIAGNTFARNRYGNCVRSRTKPVNPSSPLQSQIRTIVSFLAERWHAVVTDDQRIAWQAYADNVVMKNKLGESMNLSGFNHYIRTNACRLNAGATIIDDGPTVMSLPKKDPNLAFVSTDETTEEVVLACSMDIWAGDGDQLNAIFLYMGVPQLESVTFFKGPWRYMGAITPAEGAVGQATETSPFPFSIDQNLWVKARMITMGGRISEPWVIGPHRVINGA